MVSGYVTTRLLVPSFISTPAVGGIAFSLAQWLSGQRAPPSLSRQGGSARLSATACDLIRKGGHLAFFGATGPGETVPVDILRTVPKETSLKGWVARMGCDMHDALMRLAHGRFRTDEFTGAEYPSDRIADAFGALAARPCDPKTHVVMG